MSKPKPSSATVPHISMQVRKYMREQGKKGAMAQGAPRHRFDSATGSAAIQKRWRDARQAKAAAVGAEAAKAELVRMMKRNAELGGVQ